MSDISKAVKIFKKAKCPFILMHCVSEYPCPEEKLNLNIIKSNIKDLPTGIDTLMKLKPRIFDRQSGFISDGIDQHLDEIDNKVSYTDGEVVLEDNKRVQVGLVAQEAVDIIPEIVHNPPDKYSFYSMDYERLSVYNLAGIQDLKNEIDSQQQQIEALQGDISALQAA